MLFTLHFLFQLHWAIPFGAIYGGWWPGRLGILVNSLNNWRFLSLNYLLILHWLRAVQYPVISMILNFEVNISALIGWGCCLTRGFADTYTGCLQEDLVLSYFMATQTCPKYGLDWWYVQTILFIKVYRMFKLKQCVAVPSTRLPGYVTSFVIFSWLVPWDHWTYCTSMCQPPILAGQMFHWTGELCAGERHFQLRFFIRP